MSFKATFVLFLSIHYCLLINAKSWRVNSADDSADFNDVNIAHNNQLVQSGDTLYIEGSSNFYTSFTCTKKLTLIGPGYFLDKNWQSVNVLRAKFNAITFSPGSEGSAIFGLSFETRNFYSPVLRINANNILVKGCYSGANISITNASGVLIIGNYIAGISDTYNFYQYTFSDLVLKNNIILGDIYLDSESQISACNNNIFLEDFFLFNSQYFRNNIFLNDNPSIQISSGFIQNNISNTVFPDESNISLLNLEDLFVGGDSPDAKYLLSETSVAKGAGYNGTDCGIFGGDEPYVISGLPPIPVITELEIGTTATPTNGLKIKIQVKSN